jgi:hypothetical protein
MSVGEDSSHASIIAQINEDVVRGIRRVPEGGGGAKGPEGLPEPHVRPDDKAQWDEVHGLWMDWDEQAQKWVPASVQTPAPATEAEPTPTDQS